MLFKPKTKEEEILSKLELEYEIQTQIVSAAGKLAKDASAKKNVRKQRKQAYQQALAKMKDLESRLLVVKRQIAATMRRQQSTEDLSEDNISHSTDESQDKCENTLNKFFVTERTNKQLQMKRSASLYTHSVPSTPNKFGPEVRPLSPSIVSLPNRMKVIQRPRSAAAKSEPTFEYDTDEESDEVLRNMDDNISSTGSSSGGTNSVIVIGEHKPVLIQSPYVNKFDPPLNDGSNLCSVANRRTSFKSQDDSHLRHSTNTCMSIKEQCAVNKNHRDLQNEDTFQILRSNSLDNSIRRGTTTQRPIHSHNEGTNSPSNESHHKHYINHYPSYRTGRSETPETVSMSPTSVQSCHLAQRPLPNLPVNDMRDRYIQSPTSDHSECQMNYRTGRYGTDTTDCSSNQMKNYKLFQSSRFSFEEPVEGFPPMSPRSVTPSRFSSTTPSIDSHAINRNSSPYPTPQTPKTPKTWTETSLDFEVPTKPNKVNQNCVNSSSASDTINDRISSISNSDPTKELYVNVTPQRSGISHNQTQSLSPPTLSYPTPPMSSPQYLSPQSMSSYDRNSIASTNRSIGGDSVSSKPSAIPLSPTIPSGNGVEVTVVSVGHFQPYWEEEKPFEIEDFYKYSQKHRNSKQQMMSPVANQTVISGQQSGVRSPQLVYESQYCSITKF